LLLNISLPQSEQDEFELEYGSGFRGVGVNSAETRLFLPDHLFWTKEHWQDNYNSKAAPNTSQAAKPHSGTFLNFICAVDR
jgi:hypothetical protein